jgi:enoyl-CoA hydratase
MWIYPTYNPLFVFICFEENYMSKNTFEKYQHLVLEYPKKHILKIIMKSDKLNAANEDMHQELAYIWNDIDKDPDIHVAILTGHGKAFSAGGDFAMIEKMMEDHQTRIRVWKEARDIVYNVINCSKPIVSAMQGPAVGAGLAAGLLADISIASKKAKIVDGHTRLGVAAGDHSAIIWPLLCGMAKAKYYLLTCQPISGEEAEKIGLVSLAVDEEELQEKALEVADKLASGASTALRFTKYALNNWLRMMGPTFDASLALEFLGFDGPEAKEGLASLKEKRSPNFPGGSPI